MKNKLPFILLFFFSLYYKAQENKFISLGKDKDGNTLSYKLDKTLKEEFFFWFRIEYTEQNDPAISKSEYYINANCSNKTTAMLKYANDWRKDDEDDKIYDVPVKDIVYKDASNNKTAFLFKENCKK